MGYNTSIMVRHSYTRIVKNGMFLYPMEIWDYDLVISSLYHPLPYYLYDLYQQMSFDHFDYKS